ncbi:MAG TPA: CHAT domain-containing tetratricopeptide repeat protein [Polyangiaceae bacterium]|nr:CHAT domain-containing tetratricopeptide repeat protein [Polyangiaceae bacterium]
MGTGEWGARVGAIALAIAVAIGMTVAGPARAEGPQKKAPAAAIPEVEEAKRLNAEGARLRQQGRYDEALSLEERALRIREEALGPDHPNVAICLNNLGELYSAKGDYARAEPLHKRSLAILEKVLGRDHPNVATSLHNLALLYSAKGDYARAEPLHQRSLAINEKALGPGHPNVALSLTHLASLYRKKGDYARAEPLHLRGLALVEKALGPNHPALGPSLNNLAQLYLNKGDYARAEPLYRRALALLEKALGPNHPDVAHPLDGLARLYEIKGDYARAEPLFVRALSIAEKALGPDHPAVATSLNNLAWLYDTKGDLARAEPLYQRALAIQEKALGADHPAVATSLNNLARLYYAKGDFAPAELLHRRALAIREKVLGPDHPDVATSLTNLAGLCDTRGDYARAENLHLRALRIDEKALGPDHPAVATSLTNLALLYSNKGHHTRAEPLYQRALAIREKVLGPDHPAVANSLNNLARLYETKRDLGRAEPLYERALAIQEKALGPDHPVVATSLNNLAVLYVAQNRLPQAVTAARRATDIEDRGAAAVLTTGSEEQKRLYMSTLAGQTDWDISLHMQHAPADPGAARLALTVLLRRKGRVLDAIADSLAALRLSLAPDDRDLLARLTSVYSQLATQISRGPGGASPEHYRRDLAALAHARQKLEAAVSQRSAPFRAEHRPVTLPEVQAKIPDGAALVEISRYRPFDPRAEGRRSSWGKPRYVAYVLRRAGEPTFVDLGEAAPLDAAVDALRRALGDHDRTHDPKPAARALDALLMQPIRELLGETRWVFLSPDGPLHLIPFGALVDEQGHYLVERYLFSYLTTGRDLLRFGGEHLDPVGAPLVLANPAFGDSSAIKHAEATHRGLRSIDMVTRPLPSLESTVEEARTIARLFPGSRVLLGADATEEAVKAAQAPRLLHLATHGFFLPEQPVSEVLLAGPGAEPTAEERAALLQRENPLLRSGIALAGFNQRQSAEDDGVLTALEVAGLDLYGTRLVVLSTCESGVGEAISGEGVYGLRRALTMAGSETQVMSLWQVDTGRTRRLMQAYYQRLQGGAGRSEAMREVQLAMLSDSKTAHPNLWASFIVSGEWRTLEGQARLPKVGRVAPGARGCACEQAGGGRAEPGVWAAVAMGLITAMAGRRRSGRRAPNAERCGAGP